MPQLTTTLPSLISFDLYSYFGHVPVVLKVKHDNLVYMENNRIPLWFRHSENTHAIAADIMRNSPVSRSQLARKHKLSQGTLSKITGELLYDGIIEESDAAAFPGSAEMRTGDAGRGRPQTALQIAAKSRTYIGVNIHTYECIMAVTDAMCSAICEPLIIHYADNRPENLTALISQGIGQLSQAAAERGFPPALGSRGHNRRAYPQRQYCDFRTVPPVEQECRFRQYGTGSRTYAGSSIQ